MDDIKRDQVRKVILNLIKNGCTKYTDIEYHATVKCLAYGSRNVVVRQFYKYLINGGFIERSSRGRYQLTKKGESLLIALS